MKKYFYIMAMSALGLIACNMKEDLGPNEGPGANVNNEAQASIYHISIPASIGNDDDTKAVAFDGSSGITSTFLPTDKVYVHNVTKNAWARIGDGGIDGFGYLQPSSLQNEGKSCTLTGDLSFYTWSSNWSPVEIEATDHYNLYYQAQESNNELLFTYSYTQGQVGTKAAVSSLDYAQASDVTMELSGSTLTLDANVHFQNYGSMFRQRLSFTGIGSAPSTLRYLRVFAESGNPFIYSDNIYSSSIDSENNLSIFSNTSIMDGNGDVYFAMAFSTPPTGSLNFTAADYAGNFFSGSKALPAGDLENGKYYYGDLALAFDRHQAMPVVTDANSDPVWPGIFDFYNIRNGTSISGNSKDFLFYFTGTGTVTLTGNGTASMDSGPFLRNSVGPCNMTVTLGSNYTIDCPSSQTAISTTKGYLKLATATGGTQTLTITVRDKSEKGLTGTNYSGTESVSSLAADGFTVTLADANPSANPDGTYTFVYTVSPAPGTFSVNSNGKLVVFSPGNLQYQASTNTWRFAEHQWDYVGNNYSGNVYVGGEKSSNSSVSSSYSGWIDLFGWGTSGYNHGAVCYSPYSTSNTSADYYAYGNQTYHLYDESGQADWGTAANAASLGGYTTWRTLKNGDETDYDEWRYLIRDRATGNTVNSTSDARYSLAEINKTTLSDETGVRGVILFPNTYSGPSEDSSDISWGTINSASTTITKCTTAGWTALETAGCVFLPVAGYREGTYITNPSTSGYYWSSSNNLSSTSTVYAVNFYSNSGSSSNCMYPRIGVYTYRGLSVRLVRDVN